MPTPAPNTYPFDGSGTAVTNMVEDELHTLTLVNYRDYHFLVPDFAPFFAQGLVVQFQQTPGDPFIDLTEGIDYYPALPFIGASRATGKPVYGAISFNNLSLEGIVKLKRYQTVGGEWTLGLTDLTEITANIIYNPRTTTWEKITNVPCQFPPLDHAWELSDLVGEAELLEELKAIEDAILNKNLDTSWLNHISNFNNPHRVSKAQVGLGKVQNYAPATIAECIAASSSQLYVTPIGLKAYFDSLGLDRSLSFVSLQEVIERISVPKILTFDLFLEYMRLYGGGTGGGGGVVSTLPIVLYPTEQGIYTKNTAFKNNSFSDTTPGSVNKIINLNGIGTHLIPQGSGSVRITGRGAIGGIYVPPFVTKSATFSGTGSGTFTVPAGGSLLSIRGKGAAGVDSTSGGATVFNNTYNTTQNITIPIGVTSVALTGKGSDGAPAVVPYNRPDSGDNNLDYYFTYGNAGFIVGGNTTKGSDRMTAVTQNLRSWTLSPAGVINVPNKGVVYNSKIGYVGLSDTVARISTDGLAWVATVQNTSGWKSLTTFGDYVYAVDDLKKVRKSADGILWTVAYDNVSGDNIELSVMDNNIFIHSFSLNGGAQLSENTTYKSSTDGAVWSNATHVNNSTKYARSKVSTATVTIMGSIGVLNANTMFVNGVSVDPVSFGIKAATIIKANDKFYARALIGQSFKSSVDGLVWVDGSKSSTTGQDTVAIINGQTYTFAGGVGAPAIQRVENITLNGLADTTLAMTLPEATNTLKVTYSYVAPVINVVTPGADATITVNGGLRTFYGSNTTSEPNSRNDEVSINPISSTIVTYNSPVGTELELIYQDYDSNGTWVIKKYYSSKITNPTTGAATLIEDIDGSVVALPIASTGEWMSNKTNVVLEQTTAIPTAYVLQLVASASNSTRRVFEYKYNITGTEVTIKIVSELIIDNSIITTGASGKVVILSKELVYPGSSDNNTVPQIRTDEVTLNPNSETIVTYDCPVGTSIVLNYNEPNSVQPITHADTEWEIATSNTFVNSSIVGGTALGKDGTFSLTQWKPTNPNDYINNTDYFVRVRWVKSDATKSAWSETRSFKFSTGVTFPARDELISKFCKLVDQWGTFADGNGGTYERLIETNVTGCGYIPPLPSSTQTGNVTLQSASIVISNSTIKKGMTSVITCTIVGTITDRQYTVDYYSKPVATSDSSYQIVKSGITFKGGTGSTTIITIPLGYDGVTFGTYNGKIKVTDTTTPTSKVDSNVITATFEQDTGASSTPTPTGTSAQVPVLTISSTHTDIRVGDIEKITINLNNGLPNKTYTVKATADTITVNNVPNKTITFSVDLTITTNSSGIGFVTYEGGNNSSIVPVPSTWTTYARLMSTTPIIKSNEIIRNFIPIFSTNSKVVVGVNSVGNDIGVNENRTISATLTNFYFSTPYEVKWWWTPPGGTRQIYTGNGGTQVVSYVTTNNNGAATADIIITNNGTQNPGAAVFEVTVERLGNVVTTPGGNTPVVINFVKNTSVTLTSNIAYPAPVYVGASETLTVNVANGPLNSTVAVIVRGQYVSGNSSGVNIGQNYDAAINITTNSQGNGTGYITGSNDGVIPTPAIWTRKAIIQSSGVESAISYVKFEPAQATTPTSSTESPFCEISTNAYINSSVPNGSGYITVIGSFNKSKSNLTVRRVTLPYNENQAKIIFCNSSATQSTVEQYGGWLNWRQDMTGSSMNITDTSRASQLIRLALSNSNRQDILNGGISGVQSCVINVDGSFQFIISISDPGSIYA